MTRLAAFALGVILLYAGNAAPAAALREETVFIPKSLGIVDIKLETQIYAPRAEGRFPLVVINHGKANGNPAFQKSGAFYGPALEFVKRGYVVVAPNRAGFSKSGGSYIGGSCQFDSTGNLWADDVVAAIQYAKSLPYVDPTRIVVIGQSQGGLVSAALGARNIPGVIGIVNFAGGMRQDNCIGWSENLITAFAHFGKTSHVPALFIYGDNDSYFPKPLPSELFEAYTGAGGHAEFVDIGVFEDDSHKLFHLEEGVAIWLPLVEKFFVARGLPFEVRFTLRDPDDTLDVEDFERLNTYDGASPVVEANYRRFLWMSPPRAFAFSSDGHYGIGLGEDAQSRALANCQPHTSLPCVLYAVDQKVVYRGPSAVEHARPATPGNSDVGGSYARGGPSSEVVK
ncbi:MAG: prolyl oligopeptidase family serine peptidase [Burkholderiaceae bacterium]|jgi:dienelactone hydrolase